jgi:hypothetical protein
MPLEKSNVYDRFIQKYGRLPTERDPDYLEMLRMSKYNINDVPSFPPGKCANCGASKNDGRKYIDFGLEIDWYGTVYLCGECLHDVSSEMGLYANSNAQLEEALNEIQRLKDSQKQGIELPEKLKQAWEEFKEYHDSVSSPGNDTATTSVSGVGTDESATGTPAVDENKSNADGPKSRITKSTSVSGRKNVSSLADLLNESGN